jgi:hypothetical protein
VKQAVFLLTGSTRLITSLSIQRQTQLMDSIVTGTYPCRYSPLTLCSVNSTLYEEILAEVISSAHLPRAIPLRIVLDGRPVLQRPVSVFRNSSAEGGGVFAQFAIASHRQSRQSVDEDRTSRMSLSEMPDRGSIASPSVADPSLGEDEATQSDTGGLPELAAVGAELDEGAPLVTLQDVFAELFPGRVVR